MHGAHRVSDHIDARNRQDDAIFGTDRVWMRLRKVVDARGECVEIFPERWILRVVPRFRALGNAVELHPAIELEIGRSPVFGRPPARFTVEPQEQIGLVLHLRPAVRVKHRCAIRREDVGNAVAIPEYFRVARREGPRCRQKRHDGGAGDESGKE